MIRIRDALAFRHLAARKTGPAERVAEAEVHPRLQFFDLVDDLTRRERLSFPSAMELARAEHPQVFRAAFPNDACQRGRSGLTEASRRELKAA